MRPVDPYVAASYCGAACVVVAFGNFLWFCSTLNLDKLNVALFALTAAILFWRVK